VKRPVLALSLALSVAGLVASPARGAASRYPSDFRPVAAEGSARAAWVNPASIGAAGTQSLVLEGMWDGHPNHLTAAASTDRRAYAVRAELDDVEGVPDWTLIVANRVLRPHGTQVGSALEWRIGEDHSVDLTIGLSRPLGAGLQVAVVAEDVFEADVDGVDGDRLWRFGASFRPAIGLGFVSWDYQRTQDGNLERHWFGVGVDRSRKLRATWAMADDGEWTLRVGILVDRSYLSWGMREPDEGRRNHLASLDWNAAPIVR